MGKHKKVFISHSSEDKDYTEPLLKLLEKIGIEKEDVFCTSNVENGIQLSAEIIKSLDNQFRYNDLFVIILHSKHYYKSSVCLNEMGAAWTRRFECVSILLPGLDFKDMTGVINGDRISIKVNNPKEEVIGRLNQMIQMIQKEFGKTGIKDNEYENDINDFIASILRISNNKNTMRAEKRRF